jgi:hypothetical protein
MSRFPETLSGKRDSALPTLCCWFCALGVVLAAYVLRVGHKPQSLWKTTLCATAYFPVPVTADARVWY